MLTGFCHCGAVQIHVERRPRRLTSVLARSRVIFALSRAYTVGRSSSADEEYFDETEYDAIVAPVRIGA